MKKTFLVIAAVLMMGSSVFAGGGFDLSIGPKIGYQTAKLSYQQADIKAGFSNHFTVGIFGRVSMGRFYVQPEVLYFNTSNLFELGVTHTEVDDYGFVIPTGANVNVTLNQMNLQVPVLVGFKILDLDIVNLRAQVGPTANFVLQSKTLVDYSIGQQTPQQQTIENPVFDPKTIAWGLQAGLGVDVLNFITLDVNYNFGMSKIFKSLDSTTLGNYFDFSNIDDTKQNLFMVTVGLKFF